MIIPLTCMLLWFSVKKKWLKSSPLVCQVLIVLRFVPILSNLFLTDVIKFGFFFKKINKARISLLALILVPCVFLTFLFLRKKFLFSNSFEFLKILGQVISSDSPPDVALNSSLSGFEMFYVIDIGGVALQRVLLRRPPSLI